MATLAQIRSRLLNEISQVAGNTDFSDSELNGFINEGITFGATLLQWPYDIMDVQVELGIPIYTLPADTLMLREAYFGNRTTAGDVKPLKIYTEATLKELNPNWLDNTNSTRGRPARVCLLDKSSVLLDPRPDVDNSASGKRLYVSYVYYPAALAADGDLPVLPLGTHDFLSIYGAHKCYAGKLNNPQLSAAKLQEFLSKLKLLEPKVDRPVQQLAFHWGSEVDRGTGSTNNLADLRLS